LRPAPRDERIELAMNEDRLKKLPLFESLSKRERRQVAQHADEVDVPEGRHLVDEGDFPYEFYVIEEGTAEVRDGEDRIAELGPGDFFGETAVLEHVTRNASVIAASPMRVVVMSAQDFRGMARSMPAVAERISAAADERCRSLPA
jgi:CRP/FNR family transcriptional regulator, cyclic AMP receptor protein